jgi:hypothetical protein
VIDTTYVGFASSEAGLDEVKKEMSVEFNEVRNKLRLNTDQLKEFNNKILDINHSYRVK